MKYRLLEGTNTNLSCIQGYELIGNSVASCTETGQLEKPLGECWSLLMPNEERNQKDLLFKLVGGPMITIF